MPFSPTHFLPFADIGPVHTLAQRASESLAQSAWWFTLLYMAIALVAVGGLVAALGSVMIYVERKLAGHFQCRLGPMRVGPHGILQPIADTIKLFLKEDIVPTNADQLMHLLAPALTLLGAILLVGALPYGPILQIVDINIGVLYVAAVSGFAAMGILLGGWSSNNKWSLLGSMRAGAQIISYEVSVTMAMVVIVLFSDTLSLSGIVKSQESGWWIWRAHASGIIAFLIYLIASTAEINRTPFDTAEAESELTGGFHTEYSGMRFAFFFLAEYVNMFVVAALGATLFFGGWMPFHIAGLPSFNQAMDLIPPVVWFFGKTAVIIFLIMWFRWTFPRLRMDQLMRLEWKILLPISFVNLLLASVLVVGRWYFLP